MKDTFILLLLLPLFMIGPVAAQVSLPPENKQDKRYHGHNTPFSPFKMHAITGSETARGSNSGIGAEFVKGTYSRSPGFDSTWADRFQTVLDSLINVSNVPGASIAVLSPGQGLFNGISGISSPGIPVTSEMRFGIGSNTKLFIAAAMLKLQEDGLLSLDDSLHQWLPSIPYIDSSVTIRQMLAHHSGFFDYFNDNISLLFDSVWADTSRFWTVEEVLATIGEPHFAPGTGWSYSNTNYMLAGEVIEAASGISWVDYLHNAIFDPLVLDSTFVGAYEPRNGPVAAEWDISSGEVIINSPMTSEYSMMHAAGGILAASQEMVYWYNELFNGGLLSDASLQELTDLEPIMSYGLGIWGNQLPGRMAYTHTGGTMGYLSLMWYDIDSETVMCVLYNGRNAVPEQFSALLAVLYGDFPEKEYDAGIDGIITPWSTICDATIPPVVTLKNHGRLPLTSVAIHYQLDDEPFSLLNWTGAIGTGDTVHIYLDEITAGEGSHTFTCYTSSPNGQEEGYNFNDTACSNFIINTSPGAPAPLLEGFEGEEFPPAGWALSSNATINWRSNFITAHNGQGTAMKNNYQDATFGQHYDLELPLLNLSNGEHPVLSFAYAYAKYPGNDFDSLQVLVSSDCGDSWDVLFSKGGLALSTAVQTYDPFYPSTEGHWKQESLALDDYSGDILIRFRSICGAGNNLYLDDVAVAYTAGTAEALQGPSWSVYPNPSSGFIRVTGIPMQTEMLLLDITGRVLLRTETTDEETLLDLGPFPRGIYLLSTEFGSRKVVRW